MSFGSSVIPSYDAAFVEDRTIPDGEIVSGGAKFSKVWRMCNSGTAAWPKGTTISFIRGDRMTPSSQLPVRGDLSPGQDIDIAIDMKAPEKPGHYCSTWYLKTPHGNAFGVIVWCDIIVAEIERPEPIVPITPPGISDAGASEPQATPDQPASSTFNALSVNNMRWDVTLALGSVLIIAIYVAHLYTRVPKA
ncbi:hypothetical protein OPQ81_002439 [Rhizoctonia solani]|nr:hypothetical protein OPQ81_002439 [Rhizoctonia solani]